MSERYNHGAVKDVKKANPLQLLLNECLTRIYIENILLSGQENLEEVRQLIAAGEKVVFAFNHLSNFDAPAIISALRRHGFQDIAQRTVFILGAKLLLNKLTSKFVGGYSFIPVWPPNLKPKNAEQEKMAMSFTYKSIRATRSVIKQGGIIALFPEGGRSRTSQLIEGYPAISHYLEGNWVVPIGLYGTETVLPIGALIPRKKSYVAMNVGKPIDIPAVKADFNHLIPREEKRGTLVDYVMIEIAKLLPDEYQGVYRDISKTEPAASTLVIGN
ncbi:MAG: lysophospholipid acyltransferase family protein [Candidatus Curtissbacteria bacterium]|nr:lysophospholipid acyltransferase family protein [Candidatus Curtissbacteria bacterium]